MQKNRYWGAIDGETRPEYHWEIIVCYRFSIYTETEKKNVHGETRTQSSSRKVLNEKGAVVHVKSIDNRKNILKNNYTRSRTFLHG